MNNKKKYGFGRAERLKSRKQIQAVFGKGKQFSHFPFRVYWLPGQPPNNLQAGVGVSKRQFGKAVDRNRIKRLMREAWRLNKQPLKLELEQKGKCLFVFMIYTGNALPSWDELSAKMKTAITRLQKLIDEMDQSPA